MDIIYDGLSCCVDCVLFVANGDVPEDRPDLADDIAREWPDPTLSIVLTSDDPDEFSWSSCDCCGSRLGGERHPFVVMGPAVSP